MNKPRLSELLNEVHAQTPPLPEYDRDKVDEVVLALLYLVLHQPGPYLAWKGFDWATLDRLHAKGLIGDPKHNTTSVGLTDKGVADAAAAFPRLFGKDATDEAGDGQVNQHTAAWTHALNSTCPVLTGVEHPCYTP